MTTYQELLTVAIDAAHAAGNLIEEMAAAGINTKQKGFRDLVTEADLASQKLIVAYVKERFPDHGFLAEEEDAELSADAETVWIIDPIDGTSNYSRQIPIYCVSIAATINGEVVAGAVYDPNRKQIFAASKDGGATLDGKPIHVSKINQLDKAAINLDWTRSEAGRVKMLALLTTFVHQPRTLRFVGSATLAICWVAAGISDTYINQSVGAWDWAAASLILQEAGGKITNLTDQPLQITAQKAPAFASNGHVHPLILPYLQHLL